MSLKRTIHWATRSFDTFLRERARLPFAWGTNDCAMFAADAVQAITGTDIAGDFRSKYSSEASAFALIKTVTGGTTVADAAAWCAQQHELVEWDYPLLAKRGDLVVIDNGGQLISGVIHLNGRHAISVSESGLVRLPISKVKRAWKI